VEKRAFRLFKNGKELRCEVVSEQRWKVTSASRETGFLAGDEVSPTRIISWEQAKRRVNSCRSALSPNALVLLRGKGYERSEDEVGKILRFRPWEPAAPKPA
jgi:hypothetical protein